jgi:hypothetical protein
VSVVRSQSRFLDILTAHPALDYLAPAALLAVWFFAAGSWIPGDVAARQWAYASVATISGLSLAASTFACTITYQTTDSLMVQVRRKHRLVLKRNWISILRSTLLTAILPVIALLLESVSAPLAFGLVLCATGLLVCRFARSLYWLTFTLFVTESSERVRPAALPELRL